VLVLEGVRKVFGALVAVDDLSFRVERGEILGVIGPNGAGKSTLIEMISGFHPPTAGRVSFDGHVITGLRPAAICRRGLARTFQLAQTFASFTVFDTVLLAARGRLSATEAREETARILELTGLTARSAALSMELTVGDQKLLEIAKAIATAPKLVLLDEVMSGLNATEAAPIVALIQRLRSEGITFVMVEHIMHIVMNLCDRIVVLNFGVKIAEGRPTEIARDERVIESYLGREHSFA
jgi:ABC-type branched-subunit amino acid transport system ATPase component